MALGGRDWWWAPPRPSAEPAVERRAAARVRVET